MADPYLCRAFGVSFSSELPLPALTPLTGPARDPTRVLCAEPGELGGRWPAGGERVLQEGEPGSVLQRFVERHPNAGHRLYAGGFGEAVVSADGRTVTCAAGDGPGGRLERFLVGRVLPWTALVRGCELFHAAAVTFEDRAIVLVGPSGVGKTSLAVQLVLAGAGFLSDDVLAVEIGADDTPLAHPGARVAGLRGPERDRLDASQRATLGTLRVLDDKDYATFPVDPAPVKLGAVRVRHPPGAGWACSRAAACATGRRAAGQLVHRERANARAPAQPTGRLRPDRDDGCAVPGAGDRRSRRANARGHRQGDRGSSPSMIIEGAFDVATLVSAPAIGWWRSRRRAT